MYFINFFGVLFMGLLLASSCSSDTENERYSPFVIDDEVSPEARVNYTMILKDGKHYLLATYYSSNHEIKQKLFDILERKVILENSNDTSMPNQKSFEAGLEKKGYIQEKPRRAIYERHVGKYYEVFGTRIYKSGQGRCGSPFDSKIGIKDKDGEIKWNLILLNTKTRHGVGSECNRMNGVEDLYVPTRSASIGGVWPVGNDMLLVGLTEYPLVIYLNKNLEMVGQSKLLRMVADEEIEKITENEELWRQWSIKKVGAFHTVISNRVKNTYFDSVK